MKHNELKIEPNNISIDLHFIADDKVVNIEDLKVMSVITKVITVCDAVIDVPPSYVYLNNLNTDAGIINDAVKIVWRITINVDAEDNLRKEVAKLVQEYKEIHGAILYYDEIPDTITEIINIYQEIYSVKNNDMYRNHINICSTTKFNEGEFEKILEDNNLILLNPCKHINDSKIKTNIKLFFKSKSTFEYPTIGEIRTKLNNHPIINKSNSYYISDMNESDDKTNFQLGVKTVFFDICINHQTKFPYKLLEDICNVLLDIPLTTMVKINSNNYESVLMRLK